MIHLYARQLLINGKVVDPAHQMWLYLYIP